MINRTDGADEGTPAVRPSAPSPVDDLMHFDGPPEQFLIHFLAFLCRAEGVQAGAMLRPGPDGQAELLCVYPQAPAGKPPDWLGHAVQHAPQAAASAGAAVVPYHASTALYGQPADQHLVLLPVADGPFAGIAAFLVRARDPAGLAALQERLAVAPVFLKQYELRQALRGRQVDLVRLRAAMEVLAAINAHERFMASAMAFCNEAAARWGCDRVTLGFLKGRYVQLRAMSHTEKFSRKMKLVQDIEAAMEECLDQDAEVAVPAPKDAVYVYRAADGLAKRHGPNAVLSLPLRSQGEVRAVLTLERGADRPFAAGEIETARLACELCTARLLNLYQHDRWFGARMARATGRGIGAVLGPKHTWKKVVAILVLAAAVFLTFAKGEYTVEAPFVLEAIQRQVVPAPFEGELEAVYVKPGDEVAAGVTVLAALKTPELKLERAMARAQQAEAMKKAALARQEDKRAEVQIAEAEADQAAAKIRLLDYRIDQARIVAPISGRVISGDLDHLIGKRVKTGEALFEIAPIWLLHRKVVRAPFSGVVRLVCAAEGDHVQAGQRLLVAVDAAGMAAQPDPEPKPPADQGTGVTLFAPVSGRVVSGIGCDQVGAEVKAGRALFEIEPDEYLRASLAVPEDQIAEVMAGQQMLEMTGSLATMSRPDERLEFALERIYPVAEVVKQRNVFKARARLMTGGLDRRPDWMRPGMEGIAKIRIDRRHYAWIWTRRLINWVRMKLWL